MPDNSVMEDNPDEEREILIRTNRFVPMKTGDGLTSQNLNALFPQGPYLPVMMVRPTLITISTALVAATVQIMKRSASSTGIN